MGLDPAFEVEVDEDDGFVGFVGFLEFVGFIGFFGFFGFVGFIGLTTKLKTQTEKMAICYSSLLSSLSFSLIRAFPKV